MTRWARTWGTLRAEPPHRRPTAADPTRLSLPTALPLSTSLASAAAGPAPALSAADGAERLHALIEGQTRREPTTGSPATLLLGVEAAADLRLGSTRRLVQDEGWPSGPRFAPAGPRRLAAAAALGSVGGRGGRLRAAVRPEPLRRAGRAGARPERQRALALLPAPIAEAQLTQDAFLEQLAVGFAHQNEGAAELQGMAREARRDSSPHSVLETFGYRAGPPVSGKWGLQLRVFLPVEGKARWPTPVVAFRGTEGIQFDASGARAARQPAEPGHPLDPARVGRAREGTLDTVVGDAAPVGVGYNQFEQNTEPVAHVVAGAHAHGPLIMVGHSLGGAPSRNSPPRASWIRWPAA